MSIITEELGTINEADIYIGMTPKVFELPDKNISHVYLKYNNGIATIDRSRIRGNRVFLGFNELEFLMRMGSITVVVDYKASELTIEDLEAVCYGLFWRLWSIESFTRPDYNETANQVDMLQGIVKQALKSKEIRSKNFRRIMSGEDLNL